MTDSSLFFRLKDERKRLGLKQTEMSALAGVSRETWSRYESGGIGPGVDVLVAIAAAGADVQYVLTGQRSAQALSQDEQELLGYWRAAPLAVKAAAIGALQGGSAPASTKLKQQVSGSAHQVVGINQGEVKNEHQNKPPAGGGRKR